MPFRSKQKANYIGFNRIPTPFGAQGVWGLHAVHTEMSEHLWPGQTLYTNTDGNLNGFANSGASTSASAIYVPGNSYCYANLISPYVSMLYKTITFDVYVSGGVCGVIVGSSTGGRGPLLKIDARGGGNYSGMMYQTDWSTRGTEPITGPQVAGNAWIPVKLQINNSMRIDWFVNNLLDRQPILLGGVSLAFVGLGGGGYFRNIRVYNGATD